MEKIIYWRHLLNLANTSAFYNSTTAAGVPMGHYRVELPNVREGDPMHGKGRCVFLIGSWWVEAATKGLVSQLPVVNATQGN